MISLRAADERGKTRIDWLDGRHTFSFGQYFDPDHMGFGALRVINQDVIAPGGGFPTHGHRDMEIVTYVLSGAVQHRDSLGNGSIIRPGDVQLMTAGTGVMHSEFNGAPGEPTELLQMWVLPARQGTAPRYEQASFASTEDGWQLVVSPDGRAGTLTIGQDATMSVFRSASATPYRMELDLERGAWLHLGAGRARLTSASGGSLDLEAGDGVAIRSEAWIELEATDRSGADAVLWVVPD